MSQTSIEKTDLEYTTIRIPKAFVEGMIDTLIKEKEYGFVSRADVVKAAVRGLYQSLMNKEKKEEKKYE